MVGVVTGWIAHATNWLSQFGLIAWWFAGLLGFAVSALGLGSCAWLRFQMLKASAVSKWKGQVDDFNPLSKEFLLKRMLLADLENPVTHRIAGKRFTDCELLGPANILMIGQCQFVNCGFNNCDVIVTRPDAFISNVIILEDIEMVRGAFLKCTIYVPPAMAANFLSIPGTISISTTGNAEFDNRKFPKP